MSTKVYIVDFEDSFTFNIASTLYPFTDKVKVIGHVDFFSFEYSKLGNEKIAIILGPGPGHPHDYKNYFNRIESLKKNPNIYLMGICLGHQILGSIDGLEIRPALELIHGKAVEVVFREKNYLVQRYNSLAVFSLLGEEENIREFSNGISYQFHPESVGTENGLDFFNDLIKHIS